MIRQLSGFNMKTQKHKSLKYLITVALFILLVSSIIGSGCARTASSKEIILNMEIKIHLRGNPDLDKVNYHIVFSGVSEPSVPTPDLQEYFPTPGRIYNDETMWYYNSAGIQPLYANYFSSWADYIIFSESHKLLYNSNASGFDANTDLESHSSYEYNRYAPINSFITENIIVMNFEVKYLSFSANKIYFTFLTTKKKTEADLESGYVLDVLRISADRANIITQGGQEIQLTMDIDNNEIDDSADIVSWEARIY
ncbi:hypothetical protein ACFLZV_04260 [Candidatus Margulisiibacteriota bacterium]